ncbi:DUF4328 domain-containing protein [Microscilla marina]|uniref:DUF4328 domain-containing protein n=1 Tax=Microscilla marina ATCC 23134 TaxID=313606 RepID=A1ZSD0_MICM2|nr:DUF4328 domain-containing protein [Microscilla marina]EAY26678.1 hypothetical protein M23134_02929 [Microscilla marina ATCC 23134]
MTKKRRLLKTRLLSGYLLFALWLSSAFKVLVIILMAWSLLVVSYFGFSSEIAITPDTKEIEKKYSDEGIMFSLFFTMHLAVLITLWIYRIYKNLRTQGISTKYSPKWATFSFFILGVNFFVPYRVMQEIWVKTQHIGLAKEKVDYIPRSSTLVVVWGVTWVLYVIILTAACVPPMFGIKYQFGFGALFIIPVMINNIFILSTTLDITLLAFITQIRRFEKKAMQRIKALEAQQQDQA